MTQTINIQEIGKDKISVNVNGEIKEIQHQLSDLKKLLEEKGTQTVQYAEKIYNIEHIDEANFGFVTGKKAFNENLTKAIVEAIKPYSKPATRFLEKAGQIANWEQQARVSDKAKEIVAYSFVGVLGVQLSKLMAIGKEDFSEAKQRKYIEQCVNLAKRTLDLLNFAFLSKLWDSQVKAKENIKDEHKAVLKHFFEDSFEQNIEGQLKLLQTLHLTFKEHSSEYPIEEFKTTADQHLQTGSPFWATCLKLQEINEKLDKASFDLLVCFDAETELTHFLTVLSFLARYKMVSIKNIGYNQVRNNQPAYLHYYAALGIDSKANVDAEKVNFTNEPVQTDAVLFYKGKYHDSINLFPFVIDYNALCFEQGARVCFYNHQELDDASLNYKFLEDNSIQNVVFQKVMEQEANIEQLMQDPEKRKELNKLIKDSANRRQLNLNEVTLQFKEAKSAILGETTTAAIDDFDDVFDDEDDD